MLCLTSVACRQSQFENISNNPLEVINEELLDHVNKRHKMLLVYDGADDLSFLPKVLPRSSSRVHVLITTRCDDCSALQQVSHVISLGCLEDEDAVSALSKWSGRQPFNSQEKAAITKLAIRPPIEKLPIALAHAGTYVRKARLSYDEYYKLLQTEEVKLEALALDFDKLLRYFNAGCLHEELLLARLSNPADLKRLTDMEIDGLNMSERNKNVVKYMRNFLSSSHVHLTWQMDIDLLARENPKALSLLKYASFLSSRDIPEKLVRPLVFRDAAQYEYSLCVSALSSHNLVEWFETAGGYTLNIHPLVQSTVMERMHQQLGETECKLTDLCKRLFSQLPKCDKDFMTFPADDRSQLVSHLCSLAKNVLLAGVVEETCLSLALYAVNISMHFQPAEMTCYLSEKLCSFISQSQFELDEDKYLILLSGIYCITAASDVEENVCL